MIAEAIPGEEGVRVAVDQAGHHYSAAGVDHLPCRRGDIEGADAPVAHGE